MRGNQIARPFAKLPGQRVLDKVHQLGAEMRGAAIETRATMVATMRIPREYVRSAGAELGVANSSGLVEAAARRRAEAAA